MFFGMHATEHCVLMRSNPCYHFPVASSLLGTLPPPRQPPASDMSLSREHYNCTLPLCWDWSLNRVYSRVLSPETYLSSYKPMFLHTLLCLCHSIWYEGCVGSSDPMGRELLPVKRTRNLLFQLVMFETMISLRGLQDIVIHKFKLRLRYPNRLILFAEIIDLHYENNTEHTKTLCGQNREFLQFRAIS
jgi:hypothetical protein